MTKVKEAADFFAQGFSCSQAVLAAYGPELGLERDLALRVAGAFGGGMARMGETCGAVTGALMVIGLRHGKTRAEDNESRDRAYRLTQEFVAQFKARHGSTLCRELLGCDISTPDGRQYAADHDLTATRCPQFVRDAAELIEQ